MPRISNTGRSACGFASAVVIILLALLGQGCASNASTTSRPSKNGEAEAVPVVVTKVVLKDIPSEIRVVGNVEASTTVAVRSQVSGQLARVSFQEGDFVAKNDELFSIDARTYEAQLDQARANLAKDEAALLQLEASLAKDLAQEKYARAETGRYSSLLEKELVSNEQVEQVRANADALEAAVRADQAAIESARATVEATRAAVASARVMLSYTSIRSPIDGRTGNLDIKQGNIVGIDVPLVTINQIEPIYVTFSIPEAQLAMVKKGQKVIVGSEDGTLAPEAGELIFIDNAVDPTTGTIRLKASFPNKDHSLWPGEFVKVALQFSTTRNARLVPNHSVQTDQGATYVYVVKPDRTVEVRPVVTGARIDQDVVVEKGLDAGETIVTEGHLRLVAGSRVEFR
jgi:multidrug efflux system membrane fusion protein